MGKSGTSPAAGPAGRVRHAEIVGALSLATDLGMGQPMGWALRTCLLSVRFGDLLRLEREDVRAAYHLALLRFAGCTAESHVAAQAYGDEIAPRSWMTAAWSGSQSELMGALFTNLGADLPFGDRLRRVATALSSFPKMAQTMLAHCEVAQRLAERLGFGEAIQRALTQAYERWDGLGGPNRLRGEQTALPMRLVQLVHDAELAERQGGVSGAVETLRRHASAHDPLLLEQFCAHAGQLFDGLEEDPDWDAVLAAEPAPHAYLGEAEVETALEAMADFVDLKAPHIGGHSREVAALAAGTARELRLPATSATRLRQAGLLHDLGRVGVTSAIWIKPRALSQGERESVQLHPYYTARILFRPSSLAPLGAIAALHHERLDGSGYHRSLPATLLPIEARVLGAADAYQAMTQPRPFRPPLSPQGAAAALRQEVRAGKLDGDAVDAVLRAAGHRVRTRRPTLPAGLSEREVEVLRLLARGLSNRDMAAQLSISSRTVQHHVEHIFNKVGVSTRSAATLFAMQHQLLETAAEK